MQVSRRIRHHDAPIEALRQLGTGVQRALQNFTRGRANGDDVGFGDVIKKVNDVIHQVDANADDARHVAVERQRLRGPGWGVPVVLPPSRGVNSAAAGLEKDTRWRCGAALHSHETVVRCPEAHDGHRQVMAARGELVERAH